MRPQRIALIGLGLIGGSLGLALCRQAESLGGWLRPGGGDLPGKPFPDR